MRAARLIAGLILTSLTLTGCNLSYYWQAAKGQADLLQRRQPIPALIADPATPDSLRQQLDYVLKVRQFAQDRLHLDTGDNFLTYADLERPFVVWNVFATPALSLQNEHWCFPVAGCVPYRGYFNETDARAFADALTRQGLDTYVSGVPAYSTLGWFDDAVLNTFIQQDRLSLAGLIFHELAHRTLYVPDDSVFNESFATAVENIGLERWIETANLQSLQPAYRLAKQRQQQFLTLVLHNRQDREILYQSDKTEQEKRMGKAALTTELRNQYGRLKSSWNGYSGYDHWFSGPLNNAQLGTIATYHQLEPGFHTLLEQSGGDFSLFLQRCRQLAEHDSPARHQLLNDLAAGKVVYTDH